MIKVFRSESSSIPAKGKKQSEGQNSQQLFEYQRSCEGGTRSPPATNAAPPAKSKMAAWGPKMAEGVWKGAYPKVFGRSKQLSLNKFFDPEKR